MEMKEENEKEKERIRRKGDKKEGKSSIRERERIKNKS